MYTDYYLSFQDADEARSVLETYNPPVLQEDGVTLTEGYWTPNYQNISVLGIVYKPDPEPLPLDYVPIPYPAPNFGVNVRLLDGEDAEALKPYSVNPKQPQRVWA